MLEALARRPEVHREIAGERVAELPELLPELTYMA